MTNTEIIDCTTCKYGYEDERLGIPMCHHPKRFSEDCVNFNMHEEKETEESEKPINPEDAMKELDEKIALVKRRGTWDGVDVDKYMDEVRGRGPEKPMNQEGLEEEVNRYYSDNFAYISSDQPTLSILTNVARHFAQWGAERQKEQDDKEQADLFTIVALDSAQRAKEQMMENYPKWRRIKAGERLPCPAYVWTIAYDNYPDCFEGRLMPNIQGVKVGRDTWYLPVDVIHNLPKED